MLTRLPQARGRNNEIEMEAGSQRVVDARPYRLAFVLPSFSGGGAERVALALIRDFVARGHAVDLLLANCSGPLLDLLPPQVRVIDLKARRIRDAILPLWRYFRREKPD